jgi:hypothetical protein
MARRGSIKVATGPAAWLTSKRGRLAMIVAGLVLVSAAAAWYLPPVIWLLLARPARVALLNELQPVVLKNCDLKRFGSVNDGGYLLCDNLSEGVQSAYSYGVGVNDDLGCHVSRRYRVPVHQYDCFDPGRPVCKGGTFVFNNECIGARAERDKAGRAFDTLQGQIARNRDSGKRLIVKIDIEGAEWESLLATPDSVFDQIDQMPMELHISPVRLGVTELHLQVIRKLKQKFHLVNLHFNNYSCTSRLAPLPAWAFQVLWVNKRLGEIDPSAPTPAPMSPLNAPDRPGRRDCQLAR